LGYIGQVRSKAGIGGVLDGPRGGTEAFNRWKGALVDQAKQTTPAARHRAHARVTSMEDLIAETPADDIEGVGIKLALYVYMSGVDPETETVPSNKSCQPARIAFAFSVVTP
jgi:hypothetical protein